MEMTNEDIVRDYMQAGNKQKQIRILADLNCCSPGEIRKVLAEAGVAGVKMPERIIQRKPAAETSGPSPAAEARSVYDRIETILNALPEKLSDQTLEHTRNLLQTLFADYLEQRLGKEGRHGT